MKILYPIRKLDIVLNVITNYNEGDLGANRNYIIYNSNIIPENSDLQISHQEIRLILDKLIADGYIVLKTSMEVNSGENRYFTTFDGAVFNESGGYKIKIATSGQNEKRIVRNEKWLLRGTWVASIVGALLLLWQLFLYFYPVHKDFPLFFWQK